VEVRGRRSVGLHRNFTQPRTTEQILFALGTFFSVLVLHWLLWRYIVPVNSAAPPEVTAFVPPSSRQNFFSGATGFGYVNIALYCLDLSGVFPSPGRFGYLVLGLLLIGLRMADRLRSTFLALSTLCDHQRIRAMEPPTGGAA